MAMESYRDITTNIPDLFLGSGAPMAPPHVIFLFFRASTTPPEQLTEHPPWVAEMILQLTDPAADRCDIG